MNICVIPARGGSQRIPRKNIRAFNGRPILAHSIEAAVASECFDKVVVSTDDKEISEIAIHYGAVVPFLRPANLSNDMATTMPVIKHAIEWFEHNGDIVEDVCCLYPTAPFVSSDIIARAYEDLKNTACDFCVSVTNYPFPIQRAVTIAANGQIKMLDEKDETTRSQDLVEAYHDAGQFYWGRSEAFKEEKGFFSASAIPFILPRYLVNDIDTEEDWVMAEVASRVLKQLGLLE